jgi:septation ring formation regulator EzrA
MIRKFALIPAVVLVATFGLAACGGSSSGSSSSFCTDLKSLSEKGDSIIPSDATDSQKYSQAVDELKKLQKKAPSEIKSDLSTMIDALEKLQKGDLNAITDPNFAKKVEAAAKNIENYSTKTCKIETPTTT